MARQRKCSLYVLEQAAHERGGRCHARTYRGYYEKYLFSCKEGHRFSLSAESLLLLKHWCNLCKFGKLSVDDLKRLAAKHDGRVQFLVYDGLDVEHTFLCKRGHSFQLKPKLLLSGNWCRECELIERLERLQGVIAAREGELLTEGFPKAADIVRVRCNEGHEFEVLVSNLLRTTKPRWCPMCSGGRKTCRTELVKLAEARGGEFCDAKYRGFRTLHQFACVHQHSFLATPEEVLHGAWCPTCKE